MSPTLWITDRRASSPTVFERRKQASPKDFLTELLDL